MGDPCKFARSPYDSPSSASRSRQKWVHPAPRKKQGIAEVTDIYDEILALKEREDATILAHYYQEGEIQELADVTGDSLKLARAATEVATGTIVFCGVHFMAETAKMLNPAKRGPAALTCGPAVQPQPIPVRRRETRPATRTDAPVRERPEVPDRHLHQQHRRRQGAVRLDRHVRQRRSRSSAGCRRSTGRSSSRRTSTWARYLSEVVTGPEDDPLERLLHGPRNLQRAGPASETEGADARARMTIAHPECPANILSSSADFVGGTEAMIGHVDDSVPTNRPISSSPPRRT